MFAYIKGSRGWISRQGISREIGRVRLCIRSRGDFHGLQFNLSQLYLFFRSTQHETRQCCVIIFTEMWLNNIILDSAIQLHGLTCYRAERDTTLSGKARVSVQTLLIAGGVYNREVPTLSLREFTVIVIVAVYIPPCANATVIHDYRILIQFSLTCLNV